MGALGQPLGAASAQETLTVGDLYQTKAHLSSRVRIMGLSLLPPA